MAYNPIFTLINGFVQASLDRYFYGEKDMVPYTAWQTTYESLKVAMPLDLQSVMPPAIKVAMAAGYNMDIDGKEFYKGPDRELVDEINKEGQAGITTEQLAIDTARLIGFSPARLQAMTDSVIADNPFLCGDIYLLVRIKQYSKAY